MQHPQRHSTDSANVPVLPLIDTSSLKAAPPARRTQSKFSCCQRSNPGDDTHIRLVALATLVFSNVLPADWLPNDSATGRRGSSVTRSTLPQSSTSDDSNSSGSETASECDGTFGATCVSTSLWRDYSTAARGNPLTLLATVEMNLPVYPVEWRSRIPSLLQFIHHTIGLGRVSNLVLLTAMIYMDRLRSSLSPSAKGAPDTSHRLFLAAIMLADKYIYDVPSMTCSHLSTIVNRMYRSDEINKMESTLLNMLDHDLSVDQTTLSPYLTRYEFVPERVLEHMAVKCGSPHPETQQSTKLGLEVAAMAAAAAAAATAGCTSSTPMSTTAPMSISPPGLSANTSPCDTSKMFALSHVTPAMLTPEQTPPHCLSSAFPSAAPGAPQLGGVAPLPQPHQLKLQQRQSLPYHQAAIYQMQQHQLQLHQQQQQQQLQHPSLRPRPLALYARGSATAAASPTLVPMFPVPSAPIPVQSQHTGNPSVAVNGNLGIPLLTQYAQRKSIQSIASYQYQPHPDIMSLSAFDTSIFTTDAARHKDTASSVEHHMPPQFQRYAQSTYTSPTAVPVPAWPAI